MVWLAVASAAVGQPAAKPPDAQDSIVVTGERTTRSLKETASSVVVSREKDIEASGANRIDDVLALVPNLQLGSGSQGPAIRGLDTTGALNALPAFLGGNRPRTTIVVDRRAVTYNEFVFGAFSVWDVNRVEVFRSPQTTTQGQNSIAGAIFVETNAPSFTPEYRVRTIAGNYHMREASVVASGPIAGDKVAFRVSGDLRYSRTTSRIAPVMFGADPNHDLFGVLRTKLLAKAGTATQLVFTYTHNHSQGPQIAGLDAPFSNRRDDSVGYGIFRVNVDALTAELRQELGRNLSANIVATTGDSSSRRFAIRHFGEAMNGGRDWSVEMIIKWIPEGSMHATAGVSHQHLALKQFIDLAQLSGSIGRFHDRQDGSGVFGEAELILSERSKLTAGLRYQRDRQERRGSLTANTFVVPVDFVGTFSSWLPKVSLSYDLGPEVRIGALVQKAYNPGGTTIRVDTSRPDNFAAESLWDYELFARAQLVGLTASANLFYYAMRDAQRSQEIRIPTPSGSRVGFANLFNVPRARSYGAEGQMSWRPGSELSVSFAVGLLGTRIVRSDGEVPGIAGNEFDRSPHFSASAAVDWRPASCFQLSAQVRHHSSYFSDPENTPGTRVGSATIADARAEYQVGRVSLFVQVRNLFDSLALLDLGSPTEGEAEDPRTLAFGLAARF